jgi:hypothetical protein
MSGESVRPDIHVSRNHRVPEPFDCVAAKTIDWLFLYG